MEATEKAKEMIETFLFRKFDYVDLEDARSCAKITLRYILSETKEPNSFRYWKEVESAVNKYKPNN